MNPREDEVYDVNVIGERIGAQIVDGIVITLCFLGILFGGMAVLAETFSPGSESPIFQGVGLTVILAALLTAFLYNTLLEHYWDGQTVGKRLMGIRVLDEDGQDASLGQTIIRNVPAVFNLGVFSIIGAFISMAMTDKKQRIFDSLANTVVAKEGLQSNQYDTSWE